MKFDPEPDGVTLRFAAEERVLLASLVASVGELLGGDDVADADDPLAVLADIGAEAPPPSDDPALRRLLPDAYADDDAAASEFRRLMDGEIRRGKVGAIRRVVADIASADRGRLRLDAAAVDQWLTALNDVRLVLGVRLDMTEEREHLDDLDPTDPRAALLAAYDWLSWLQEVLVEAAMRANG